MTNTIIVRCNGPEEHENEVRIDALFTPCFVMRENEDGLPRRRVLDCEKCAHGKVIITPEMIRMADSASTKRPK